MDAENIFLDRRLAPVIVEALRDTPVVILLGSRQCGKTTLARRLAPDRPLVSLDAGRLRQAAVEELPERREPFGHLLESFVVQQLVAQAA